MIELTGMRNAVSLAGLDGHCQVEIERLLDLDPSVLILSAPDEGGEFAGTLKYLKNERSFRFLQALQLHRVATIQSRLFSSASHFILDAAEHLAAQVDAF